MIVIDASIIIPFVLDDEPSPPVDIGDRLLAERLIAPVHWPLEIANALLAAYRRRRLLREEWIAAPDHLSALGVEVDGQTAIAWTKAVAILADQERLTIYDAAYLHLAMERSATLATLDTDLIEAAGRRGTPVLTYA